MVIPHGSRGRRRHPPRPGQPHDHLGPPRPRQGLGTINRGNGQVARSGSHAPLHDRGSDSSGGRQESGPCLSKTCGEHGASPGHRRHGHFVDRYVADEELIEMVRSSHIVVIPYDNTDQVTSGVVTDALAAGRPVVATRFPHAEELVGSGSGIVVDHDSAGPGRRAKGASGVARGLRPCGEIGRTQGRRALVDLWGGSLRRVCPKSRPRSADCLQLIPRKAGGGGENECWK